MNLIYFFNYLFTYTLFRFKQISVYVRLGSTRLEGFRCGVYRNHRIGIRVDPVGWVTALKFSMNVKTDVDN